jgi:hypothetical protein
MQMKGGNKRSGSKRGAILIKRGAILFKERRDTVQREARYCSKRGAILCAATKVM